MRVTNLILAMMLAGASLLANAQSSIGTGSADTASGTTSTATTLQGHDGFNCASGSTYQMVNGIATCKVTTASSTNTPAGARCASATLSQGSCSFNFPATTSGSSPSVQNSATGFTGSGTATCTNGVWGGLAASCTPTNCSSAVATSGSCSYSIPGIASGSSSTVQTSTANYSGSITATCSNGSLSYSNPSCSAATTCAAGTLSWSDPASGTGAACSASASTTASGSSVTLYSFTNGAHVGHMTFSCSRGTWSPVAGSGGCFSPTTCPTSSSQSYAQLSADTGAPVTAFGGCNVASLNLPATLGGTGFPSDVYTSPQANTTSGYWGMVGMVCGNVLENYNASTKTNVGGWIGANSFAPYTCGDSTAACSQANSPVAYTVASCNAYYSAMFGSTVTNYTGSIVLAVSSQCNSSTGDVWKSFNSIDAGLPFAQGCNSLKNIYIVDGLGFTQQAVATDAKKGATRGTYYAKTITGQAVGSSISLVFSPSAGTWTVKNTPAGSSSSTTLDSGTFSTQPSTKYDYQVFSAQPIEGGAGMTPTGVMYQQPLGSWTSLGTAAVATCTVRSDAPSCTGEWVINFRQTGTTTPVYSVAVRLSSVKAVP